MEDGRTRSDDEGKDDQPGLAPEPPGGFDTSDIDVEAGGHARSSEGAGEEPIEAVPPENEATSEEKPMTEGGVSTNEDTAKSPRGESLATFALITGLVSIGLAVFWSVLFALNTFLGNICFGRALGCCSGLVGFLVMLGAIVLGIISLVTGAGKGKVKAILGIVMGVLYIPIIVIADIMITLIAIFVL